MKVDIFSEIINIKDGIYLYNNRTGLLSIIDNRLQNELARLKKQGAFSPEKVRMSGKNLTDFIENGHIHNFSKKEFQKEKEVIFEKRINDFKLRNKIPSINIHPNIIYKWCSINDNNTLRTNLDIFDLKRNLKFLEQNDYRKINIWFDYSFCDDLPKFLEVIRLNKFVIQNLYIYTNFFNDSTIIKKVCSFISYEFNLFIKTGTNESYNSYTINNFSILSKCEINFYCQSQFVFCPFLYNTFFLNKNNETHFCPVKLNNGKAIENELSNRKNDEKSRIEFKIFCKETECRYEYYCSEYCNKLKEIFEKNADEFSSDNCKVAQFINEKIKNKLNEILKPNNGKE